MFKSKGVFVGAIALVVLIAAAIRLLTPVQYRELKIGSETVRAEVAATIEAKQKGLSGRSGLADGQGMLFLFSSTGAQGFWMKGMRFPIDIVWLNGGTVVDIASSVPPPASGEADTALQVYYPRLPANAAVELGAGVAARAGLKIGDTVSGI